MNSHHTRGPIRTARRLAAVALFALITLPAAFASGQGIELKGPENTLQPFQNGWIRLSVLTAEQATTAEITV